MLINLALTLWAIGMKLSGPWINKLELKGEKKHFKTVVDDFIPLVTVFIVPYFSYYLFLIVPAILMFKDSELIYRQFMLSFGVINVVASTMFVFLQSAAPRVEVQKNNVTGKLLVWHYGLANPVNAFPSLHVADSVCIAYFASIAFPEVALPLFIIAFLISISTVFTKEHYFLDLISGFVLAIGVSQSVIYLWDRII